MQKNEKLIGILNDLIQVNNDRYDGYKKALKITGEVDQDLRKLFFKLADQSRRNTSGLISKILRLRTTSATGAGFTGTVYQTWSHLKKDFTATEPHSVLDFCEYMETLVHKMYDMVINMDEDIPEDIHTLLTTQMFNMKGSYNIVNSNHGISQVKAA